jgi:alpha-1,3-mannosyltransferase
VDDPPLKILQVTRVYWPNLGGIEKIAQGLSEHLVRRGHTCDVVTLDRAFEDGRDLPSYEFHNGVNVYRIPFRGSTRYPLAPRVLGFVRRYDLVHVHAVDFLLDWLVLNKKRHGRPVVVSTHGGFFHTSAYLRLKKLWFRTLTPLTLRGVDRVLCSSEHDQELFEQVSDRCELARNAVELAVYAELENEPRPGNWIVVGRLDVHKGIGQLMETLAVVRELDPRPFLLRVIGPEVVDGLVAKLTAQRNRLGLQEFVSFDGRISVDELYEAVRTAELGLFPSEYEAFGISVVEAMGAGVVPVLNDIGPFRNFVSQGVNGFIADFADPRRAAAVILEARNLGERRPAVSSAARAKALEYGWDRTVDRFEDLYREVLGARHG